MDEYMDDHAFEVTSEGNDSDATHPNYSPTL